MINLKLFILLSGLAFVKEFPEAGGHKWDIIYAKLPNVKLLLHLADFDKYIVDKQMGEMYFALIKPPAYKPDINYASTITKISGTPNYTQETMGETPEVNSMCVQRSGILSPMTGDKALFYRVNRPGSVQAMWSSNPSRYIWSMRCSNYYPGKTKCLFNEASFGVYVHGNLDDVPMTQLAEDLCGATGLKFGAEHFKWFFSFGKNTLCV